MHGEQHDAIVLGVLLERGWAAGEGVSSGALAPARPQILGVGARLHEGQRDGPKPEDEDQPSNDGVHDCKKPNCSARRQEGNSTGARCCESGSERDADQKTSAKPMVHKNPVRVLKFRQTGGVLLGGGFHLCFLPGLLPWTPGKGEC